MRANSLKWFLLSLLLLVGAVWFWGVGNRKAARVLSASHVAAATNVVAKGHAGHGPKSLRLSNTDEALASLQRNDHAILLRNAIIDTRKPLDLDIPAELRATNGRNFIVQSGGPLDAAFYAALDRAGAKFISYIPNNAALVEADSAAGLNGFTVIPFEPYYKLSPDLLEASLNHEAITNALRVLTPPGSDDQALADIHTAGWALLGQDRTPLGPEFIVQVPGADPAIAAAQWPLSQEIEQFRRRQPLNDLTRARIGVASNTVSPSNYLGLTGTNVFMNLNDTGAEGIHPDLTNRVFNLTSDYDGHGTHVAGILIGDGTESGTISNAPNLPSGSKAGANFRGMAPQAKLFVQPIDLVLGPYISDEFLQTNASVSLTALALANADHADTPTNGFISNNSWGSGNPVYDLEAASYDAAVRDAQPLLTGEQAMTYVFAAGNSGSGSGNGIDGIQSTISSPGTAKNVITVGAIDMPRHITNKVSLDCATTNQIFLPETSDSNLVAYFSSCGNVAPGVEGLYGRFKPDVVAPGVFIVSARSTNFVDPTNLQTLAPLLFPAQTLPPGGSLTFNVAIPDDAFYVWFQAAPNELSPNPFPTLTLTAGPTNNPTLITGTNPLLVTNLTRGIEWQVSVTNTDTNSNTHPLSFDFNVFIVETNYECDYFTVLSNINQNIAPFYRYESGTSMSAPAAAGTLALVQQWFVASNHLNPSPALLKALLINGARSLGGLYDFNTQPSQGNEQGWGLVNLPNSIPRNLGGNTNMAWVDQSQSTPLRTGQSVTYKVNVPNNSLALNRPLRFTLVWTDPPGNPAAGQALVNDLDLIVTDSTGTNVYVGNDFRSGEIYTEVSATNNLAASDTVNNVENVYIGVTAGPLSPPYTVTIRGTRVNVNALTTQTNAIEQDYALVVSSDASIINSSLTLTPQSGALLSPNAYVTPAINNLVLLNQRVGANSPYDYNFAGGLTNGTTNQWHFFIFTNDTVLTSTNQVNETNVAFLTFLPPDLSIPRISQQADLDLYVSTNPNLTNLDSTVIAQAISQGWVSRQRGGTESVVITEAPPQRNTVYYIGVKSEDQQAAVFGFIGAVSADGFSQQADNGDITLFPIPAIPPGGLAIPDGSFDRAGYVQVLTAVEPNTKPIIIRHVQVLNGISHQNSGDLVGAFNLQGDTAHEVVLNNHNGFNTNYPPGWVYDDAPEGSSSKAFPGPPLVPTDSPGSLRNFTGKNFGIGSIFELNESDNAVGQIGSINAFGVFVEHQPPNTGTFNISIAPGGFYYGFVDVPTDATNLTISVTFQNVAGSTTSTGPVAIYATNTNNVSVSSPGTNNINAPGGQLVIDQNFTPPLSGGTWYYLIHNENTLLPVNLNVTISIQERLVPNWVQTITNSTATPITTDAHTPSQICITNSVYAQQVVSLDVGVRIDDTNLDDLVLHLQSPQGTSVLLFENRGGPAATNLGMDIGTNQVAYTLFTENTNLTDTLIKFTPQFAVSNAVLAPTVVATNDFEGKALVNFYTNGQSITNWTVLTNQVEVVADTNNAHSGTNFIALVTGGISRTFDTIPGASYQLVYYARQAGITNWWPAEGNPNDIIGTNDGITTNIVYDIGKIGRVFEFDGVDSSVNFGTNAGNFGSNEFTIDYWANLATNPTSAFLEKEPPGCTPSTLPSFWRIRTINGFPAFEAQNNNGVGSFKMQGAIALTDLQWHHFAWTRRGQDMRLYVDGQQSTAILTPTLLNLTNAAPVILGRSAFEDCGSGTSPLSGAVDELDFWNRGLTPTEVKAIYDAGSAGKYSTNAILANMTVKIDGVETNLFVSYSNTWQGLTNVFVAASPKTTVEFLGNSPVSMLLDDVALVELPATNYPNYYLPEESLNTFVGENPEGCWTLDVWDTRTDSPLPTDGVLKSWTLNMTFSSTNVNLIVLTNHVPYTNGVPLPANSYAYFGFDVTNIATYATNTFTNASASASPLSLIFNQSALPTGTSAGDFVFTNNLSPGDGSTNVISVFGSDPPLIPGERYFLSVYNPGPGSADFFLQVDTDEPTNILTPLLNNVPVTSSLTPGVLNFYYFDVPANAIMATFQVLNPQGEVDLYAHFGYPLPGPLKFDYQSSIYGTNNQMIAVYTNDFSYTTNSAPVPLSPGRWYLSTVAPGGVPVNYDIVASVITTTNDITIIPLTDGVPTNGVAAPGFSTTFYVYTNVPNSSGVIFTLANTSGAGNIDLLVGSGSLPTLQQAYAGSLNPGIAPELLQIGTGGIQPYLTNTWYLAVPNESATSVKYSIEATNLIMTATTNFPAVSQAKVLPGLGLTVYWSSVPGDTYEVDYSTDLLNWTKAVSFKATTTQSSFTDFTPMTNRPGRFYRLQQVH